MNKTDLIVKANIFRAKVAKHAPEILTVGSIASQVATPILSARAFAKSRELAKQMEIDKAQMEIRSADANEMKRLKLHYAGDFAKCWAPTALTGAAGIACTLGHYGVMKKRYASAVATGTALAASFAEYRQRVVDDLGKEKDMEYRTGIVRKEGITVTTNEDGVEEIVDCDGVIFPEKPSIYACWFDAESAPNDFKANLTLNLDFLTHQESYANRYLDSHGILFLNDVRKMLGMKPTLEGQLVGWVKGKDSYVDFGIYNPLCSANKKALELNDDEVVHDGFFLDFNVQGNVYDLLPSGKSFQEHEDEWPQQKSYN